MAGCRSRSLLHMDPSPGLPRLVPTELPRSSPTSLLLSSPPHVDQVWTTGGPSALGRPVLGPCRPPSLRNRPRHVAAHKSHRDLGLWPCCCLLSSSPIIWGKWKGDHNPPLLGLTRGLGGGGRSRGPTVDRSQPRRGEAGSPRPHPGLPAGPLLKFLFPSPFVSGA